MKNITLVLIANIFLYGCTNQQSKWDWVSTNGDPIDQQELSNSLNECEFSKNIKSVRSLRSMADNIRSNHTTVNEYALKERKSRYLKKANQIATDTLDCMFNNGFISNNL